MGARRDENALFKYKYFRKYQLLTFYFTMRYLSIQKSAFIYWRKIMQYQCRLRHEKNQNLIDRIARNSQLFHCSAHGEHLFIV